VSAFFVFSSDTFDLFLSLCFNSHIARVNTPLRVSIRLFSLVASAITSCDRNHTSLHLTLYSAILNTGSGEYAPWVPWKFGDDGALCVAPSADVEAEGEAPSGTDEFASGDDHTPVDST
jgi:hypothetical protein